MDVIMTFPGGGLRLDRPFDPGLGCAGRAALDEFSALLQRDLHSDLHAGRVGMHPASAQPAVTAVWLARFEDARASGWRPVAVAGHSAGDWTAAVVAGVLSSADALRLLVERGRLIDALCSSTPGTMVLFVGPAPDAVERYLKGRSEAWVAAVNGRRSTTVAVATPALPALLADVERERFATVKTLGIPFASHSPLMQDVALALEARLATTPLRGPALPWYSAALGRAVTNDDDLAVLLAHNIARRVLWSTTIRAIRERLAAPFGDLLPGGGMSSLLRDAGVARADVITVAPVKAVDGAGAPEPVGAA